MVRESSWIPRHARRALAIGGALALLFTALPFLNFIFGYLITLVHELGHALAGWIFGYPSIPAFDFSHGGGVTMHQERQIPLLLLIYAGFGTAAYRLRTNQFALMVVVGFVAVYSLTAFTPLHEMLQLFMGHGAELIFAGVFLYRALSGEKIKTPAERPAYAFAGFFILFNDLSFAWGLLTSHERRVEYELAKGGGSWMDFSRIAAEYLHTELTTVAGFFLLGCLATPLAVLAIFRHRADIRRLMGRLAPTAVPE